MVERLSPINAENKRLCIALNNIRLKAMDVTSDEAVFLQWLSDGLKEMRTKNDMLQEVCLKWNQGACQTLDEILGSFEDAHNVLKHN
ncbi:MAG: hypothetical protein JEZ12_16005 [Desulfobacterium sp.]|nr:hypothetical protein [Desulfobacterium sp.]